MIEGYKFPYRISEAGIVESFRTGRWVPVAVNAQGHRSARVRLMGLDGKRITIAVAKLMANAFMGGVPNGYGVFHKNRAKLDNELENLELRPLKSCGGVTSNKPVLKIDRRGNVVEIYRSAKEAAKKNHMSASAMYERCGGKIKNPFRVDGYAYQYEEQMGRPRKGLIHTKT